MSLFIYNVKLKLKVAFILVHNIIRYFSYKLSCQRLLKLSFFYES